MNLTRTERWTLANQYRILEALYPDEAENMRHAREALQEGFAGEYETLDNHIYDGPDTMTKEQCREVLDIFRMFSQIHFSLEKLEDKTGIDLGMLTFSGFDGNNETGHMSYARFLKGPHGDNWPEFTGDLNSHMPSLDVYRRQLAEWKGRSDEMYLTQEDLQAIAAAARYPRG